MMYCTCQQHVFSSSYHHSKFISRMSDFDDHPFSLPQNWGKHMDFQKNFFASEVKIFEITFCLLSFCRNLMITVRKVVDDFLASYYGSLTTESSHFVWSITLQNLTQFQKSLVFWISIRSSICLWNLRKI